VTSVVGELADPTTLRAAVGDGLGGIVHLAAVTSVLRSVEDPAGVYESNVATRSSASTWRRSAPRPPASSACSTR
jgi:UDP-glucose 4-epimerase